jgi:hypothetical protein
MILHQLAGKRGGQARRIEAGQPDFRPSNPAFTDFNEDGKLDLAYGSFKCVSGLRGTATSPWVVCWAAFYAEAGVITYGNTARKFFVPYDHRVRHR